MQKYHRKRHRYIWLVLLPVAIGLIMIAVIKRPQWPVMDAIPDSVTETDPSKKIN